MSDDREEIARNTLFLAVTRPALWAGIPIEAAVPILLISAIVLIGTICYANNQPKSVLADPVAIISAETITGHNEQRKTESSLLRWVVACDLLEDEKSIKPRAGASIGPEPWSQTFRPFLSGRSGVRR